MYCLIVAGFFLEEFAYVLALCECLYAFFIVSSTIKSYRGKSSSQQAVDRATEMECAVYNIKITRNRKLRKDPSIMDYSD